MEMAPLSFNPLESELNIHVPEANPAVRDARAFIELIKLWESYADLYDLEYTTCIVCGAKYKEFENFGAWKCFQEIGSINMNGPTKLVRADHKAPGNVRLWTEKWKLTVSRRIFETFKRAFSHVVPDAINVPGEHVYELFSPLNAIEADEDGLVTRTNDGIVTIQRYDVRTANAWVDMERSVYTYSFFREHEARVVRRKQMEQFEIKRTYRVLENIKGATEIVRLK